MEKYSKFKDPLTGINPFIQPKKKKITLKMILLAIIKLPVYILYLLGFPVVGFLIKIKKKSIIKPHGLIYCNSATEFDKSIVKAGLNIATFGNFKFKTCVFFPEKTTTNNTAILKYEDENDADYVVGLRYSNECIYMYGNRFLWLIRFLGSSNTVEIDIKTGSNLSSAASLPRVIFDYKDKAKFLDLVSLSQGK